LHRTPHPSAHVSETGFNLFYESVGSFS